MAAIGGRQYQGDADGNCQFSLGPQVSYDPDVRALALLTMRKDARLSQEALAEKSGMSRSLIAAVETGRSGLSVENLLAWVDACDGDVEDVIPYKGAGPFSRFRRLPAKRQELVLLLISTLEWSEEKLVNVLGMFLRSFQTIRGDVAGMTGSALSDESPSYTGEQHD